MAGYGVNFAFTLPFIVKSWFVRHLQDQRVVRYHSSPNIRTLYIICMFLYLATSQIDLTSVFVSYTSMSMLTLTRTSSACKQYSQVTQWTKLIKINLILIISTCIRDLLYSSREPKFLTVHSDWAVVWTTSFLIPRKDRDFSHHHYIHFSSGTLPASCPMGNRMPFISIRWPEHGTCPWPPSKSKTWMHGIIPLLPHMPSKIWCWIRHRHSIRYWKLQFIT